MNYFLLILLSGLACYRITRILTKEEGPLRIFESVRLFLGQSVENNFTRSIAILSICPYCLGVWIALPLALLINVPDVSIVISIFAISGIQALLQRIDDYLSEEE